MKKYIQFDVIYTKHAYVKNYEFVCHHAKIIIEIIVKPVSRK